MMNEKKLNAKFDKELEILRKKSILYPACKILLLGPGDSGKTTLLKQMKILHGDGFSVAYRSECKSLLSDNLILSAKLISSYLVGVKEKKGLEPSEQMRVLVMMTPSTTPLTHPFYPPIRNLSWNTKKDNIRAPSLICYRKHFN